MSPDLRDANSIGEIGGLSLEGASEAGGIAREGRKDPKDLERCTSGSLPEGPSTACPTVTLRLSTCLFVADDCGFGKVEFNVDGEVSESVGQFDWLNTRISGITFRSVVMEAGKSPNIRLSFLAFLSRFIASGVEIPSCKGELAKDDGASGEGSVEQVLVRPRGVWK